MPANTKQKKQTVGGMSIIELLSAMGNQIGQAANQTFNPMASQGPQLMGQMLGSPIPGTSTQTALPAGAEQAGQTAGKQLQGPYAKGVEKALKEGGYAHAQEALMAGMPANQIEQQAGLSQPQQQPQQGQIQSPGDTQAQQNLNLPPGSIRPPSSPWSLGGYKQDINGNVYYENPGALGMLFFQGGRKNEAGPTMQKMAGKEPMQAGIREAGMNEMLNTLPTQMIQSQQAAAGAIKPLMESRSLGEKVLQQRTPEVLATRQQLGKAPSATVSALQAKMERIAQLSDQIIQREIAKDGGFQTTPGGNKYKIITNKKGAK